MDQAIEDIKNRLIRLSAKESPNDEVLLETDNDDRFFMKIHEITEACSLYSNKVVRSGPVKFLLKTLLKWLRVQRGIDKAFVTYRDLKLRLIVIKKNAHLDEHLLDSLADLDIMIANDPDLAMLPFDSIALPCVEDQEIATFLNPEYAIKLEF